MNRSTLTVRDSTFENSFAHLGGAIYKISQGSVGIDNCSFSMNTADYGGTIYIIESHNLRLSNTKCEYLPKSEGVTKDCIAFDIFSHSYSCNFFTLNFTIDNGTYQISSKETKFLQVALDFEMIFAPREKFNWKESQFASGK